MPYPARIDVTEIGARSLAVVERRGWHGWGLRDVAAELGVTANALYRHAAGRDGVAILIGAAAAAELREQLARNIGSGRVGPERRVVRLARSYVDFAVVRPHAYAAFMQAKPDPDHPAISAWMAVWDDFNDVVRRAAPDAADATAFALWALLHGKVELAIGPTRLAATTSGLDDAVRALLAGFVAGSPVASPLPAHARRDRSNDPA